MYGRQWLKLRVLLSLELCSKNTQIVVVDGVWMYFIRT